MPSVPMLLYHKVAEVARGSCHPAIHVRPAQFVDQLALLRRLGAHPISLSDYLAYRRGDAELPPRAVVLTFDDGYLDNYEVALPILQRFGFPATVFLVSQLIGKTNAWDPDEPQVPLVGVGHIREMQRARIEFQSHTCTHPRLTTLTPAAAARELGESRTELEQVLGRPVCAVAYPWGAHDPMIERLAEDAGYTAGVIVRRRTNFAHTPRFALRRIGVWRSTSLGRLAWDLFRLRWRGD